MLSYELAEYKFLGRLGKGSFGEVFRVQRLKDGAHYALKRTKLDQCAGKDSLKYILNQVRVQVSLSSPFLVKMYDCFYESVSGSLVTVSELLEGGDLEALIQQCAQTQEAIPEPTVWAWAYQLLRGLELLHSRGIMHRDVKAANVLLSKDKKRVKLCDFNTSFIAEGEGRLASTRAGTPFYLSPEVWQKAPYDSRADIWSLGCLVYEMCNLRPPFSGLTLEQLRASVKRGTYSPVRDNYSKQMKQFINECLTGCVDLRPTAALLLSRSYFKRTRGLSERKQNLQEQALLPPIPIPKNPANIKSLLPPCQFRKKRASSTSARQEQTPRPTTSILR